MGLLKTIMVRMKNKNNNCHFSLKSNIGQNVVFEGDNYVGENSSLVNCQIGKMSYIALDCSFTNTIIGRYCSIGPNCRVVFGDHPTNTFVSSHPAFYTSSRPAGRCYVSQQKFQEIRYIDDSEHMVRIGNDVWLATNVTILAGVRIGDGAIVAAGAIVTHDVPPYAIVSGVPAKVVRYRFMPEQIGMLMKQKWWNRDEQWICDHAEDFSDIEKLLTRINAEES